MSIIGKRIEVKHYTAKEVLIVRVLDKILIRAGTNSPETRYLTEDDKGEIHTIDPLIIKKIIK